MMTFDSATRRDFVKVGAAALVGAATSAAATAIGADAERQPGPRKTIETDVLVCGGGCAGTVAALAAARQGAKTLLVEKAPFAGGIITSVGLPYFDGIANIQDNRIVVRGIPEEWDSCGNHRSLKIPSHHSTDQPPRRIANDRSHSRPTAPTAAVHAQRLKRVGFCHLTSDRFS